MYSIQSNKLELILYYIGIIPHDFRLNHKYNWYNLLNLQTCDSYSHKIFLNPNPISLYKNNYFCSLIF